MAHFGINWLDSSRAIGHYAQRTGVDVRPRLDGTGSEVALSIFEIRTEVLKMLKYAPAAMLALGMLTASAQAQPATKDTSIALGAKTGLIVVAHRNCWWHNGQKRCRSLDGQAGARIYGNGGRNSGYYERDASKLPFGSKQWWLVKEAEGSAGRP